MPAVSSVRRDRLEELGRAVRLDERAAPRRARSASTPHTASRPTSLAPRSAMASATNARASFDSTSPVRRVVEHHLGSLRPRSRRARGRRRAPGARRAARRRCGRRRCELAARWRVAAATTSAAQSTARGAGRRRAGRSWAGAYRRPPASAFRSGSDSAGVAAASSGRGGAPWAWWSADRSRCVVRRRRGTGAAWWPAAAWCRRRWWPPARCRAAWCATVPPEDLEPGATWVLPSVSIVCLVVPVDLLRGHAALRVDELVHRAGRGSRRRPR